MKSIPQAAVPQECQVADNAVQGKESAKEYMLRRSWVFMRGLVRKYRNSVKSLQPRPDASASTGSDQAIRTGDLVRVRSLEEIKKTVDQRGFTKGCKFMTQMASYCGGQYRVAGEIEKFFDEARCRTLNCRNLVLLDRVHCDGTAVGGCDRMCFLFWRTEWLEKVEESQSAISPLQKSDSQ